MDDKTPVLPSSEPRWLMPVVDIVLAFAAWLLAYWVRYSLQIIRPVNEENVAAFAPYIPYMLFFTIWLIVNYRGDRLYRNTRGRPWMDEVYTIINGATNATVVVMAFSFIIQPEVFSRLMLVYVAGLTVFLLSTTRIIQRIIRSYLRARGIGLDRVLIVGVGEAGQAVLRVMLARKEMGYFPVGYLDDNPDRGEIDLGRVRGLGPLSNLKTMLKAHNVQTVVITLKWKHYDRITEIVGLCEKAGVQVRVVPDVFQLNMKQVQVENLDGIPLLGMSQTVTFRPRNRVVKRVIDLLIVLVISPLLLMVAAVVALAIRLEGPGPILYRQKRVGENGKTFHILKFRSMVPDADQMRQHLVETHELDPRHPKIPDDPRITRVGRMIRKTSLDELPNFINVLRGHMSLVGPRPPTPDEVDLYETWHMQRLTIMPGITGLWQISGRSDVPFDEMCLLDIYYIENWSVKLDMQILMMTLPRVLMRHGAY
jgi:exopolysaccharide biosynthesis polyprenyl glycosylphosphotransferase